MHRICTSLATAGYAVTLVGRRLSSSLPLDEKIFNQKRIRCWFTRGKLFYAEYNLRLLFYLLFQKADAICAIDLDTIIPCYYASKWKGITRIYDAHELFTELKEVITRPKIRKAWTRVEKKYVPQFKQGYTVSEGIAAEFNKRYGVSYTCIRNMPLLRDLTPSLMEDPFILYQGAVNEARGFEQLIPALKEVNCRVVICGDGNFMPQLKQLIRDNGLTERITLTGMLPPDELWSISQKAYAGIAVAEQHGLNQYLALPNKFFDYIQAGVPQVTMNFPEYRAINEQFEVAVLINELTTGSIAAALNNLLGDTVLHERLRQNCLKARLQLNWQQEEKKLISFYHTIFNP